MIKTLLFVGLFSASLCSHGCKQAAADRLETQNEQSTVKEKSNNTGVAENTPQKIEKAASNSQTVNFKGVSFNYNPQIFGAVKMEEADEQPLEREDDKPNENFPKHLEFYFSQTDSFNQSIDKGNISVVPMENYRQMFAVSSRMTKAFDVNLKDLEKLLANKNFRDNGQIPFMPFYDAEQEFIAKVEHIPFQNGRSLCFLTQYVQETTLINNEQIGYYCQGFTDDKRNYVIAEFPVSVSFLPKDVYVDEFEGYKMPQTSWNMNKNETKQYEDYISKITKRLNDLDFDKYEPSLNSFRKIIGSLKIEK